MKIGYLQFEPILGKEEENVEKVFHLLSSLDQIDLLVLPELANSGYNFSSSEEAFRFSSTIEESIFLRMLQKEAKRLKGTIITGFCEREGDKLYNSALIVDGRGVQGKYRKLHLFYREKEFFEPGNLGLPTFDVKGVKVGVLVCFDWIFPETWRLLALKGVQIVAHCANLVLPGMAQKAVPVQAMINRIFAICSNRIGEERGLRFTGNSLIASPRGEIIVEASDSAEELHLVEIDPALALDKQVTPLNNLWEDRRTDVYKLEEVFKK